MKLNQVKQFNLEDKDGAIFIMPRSSGAWVGAEALWITVAGWSLAAKRKWGNAWVITSDRIAQAEEVIHYPLVNPKSSVSRGNSGLKKWIPLFFKTVAKDISLWMKSRDWDVLESKPWSNHKIAFVWQQHDLFPGPGHRLARELNVPLVTYVHAPVVWETAKWGVKRYGWGKLLEQFIEARSLRESDIVACVSEEVAEKLIQMGVESEKILVSPMAIDPFLFEQAYTGNQIRKELGLENNIVIGWTGSFRSFHGLDLLIQAFKEVHSDQPNSRLLLVGDGSERKPLEKLVSEMRLSDAVIFTGRQPFAKIPSYISIFDIAVVSARSAEGFHYSPLKLREYLAAGKPVLAPYAGDIPHTFKDDFHLKLYTVGNERELVDKLKEFINHPAESIILGEHGKKFVLDTGTWDHELMKVTKKLA